MDCQLKDIGMEDVEDILYQIENSFQIAFIENELSHITNFGELCDYIKNKLDAEHKDDCTSQQAFYKMREALCVVLHCSRNTISPNTGLDTLFPKNIRRKKIKNLKEKLGLNIQILVPPAFILYTLAFALVASLVTVFLNWKIGLTGLISSSVFLYLANRFANNLNFQTVGELSRHIACENYAEIRRDAKTYNRNEIENVLVELFSKGLDIEKNKLTRDAQFSNQW